MFCHHRQVQQGECDKASGGCNKVSSSSMIYRCTSLSPDTNMASDRSPGLRRVKGLPRWKKDKCIVRRGVVSVPGGWGVLSREKGTDCGSTAGEWWLSQPATAKKRGAVLLL